MEPSFSLSPSIQRRIVSIGYVLLALAFVRLAMLGLYPLMDTTEARYAEMGRKMVELNDWVTPWFDYNVPFWGKPPLSFWMTAISFKLFGVNEFAARLPHFLCGLLIVWIVWKWQSYQSKQQAFVTVVLLATSLLFYASSGLVMTDMWLLLGSALAMIGFWSAIASQRGGPLRSPWLFFLGIAIGLLAKGPIVLVLAGAPIFLWMVFKRAYVQVWHSLPWVWGGLATLLLTLPWYIAAELKTPGFLDYFIAGEHFYRFVVPGWQGDLYGTAHDQARGTIWLYLLLDALPWSLLFAFLPVYLWKKGRLTSYKFDDQGRDLYLTLFVLVPAIFFSFSGNILWPYVITAFPALAILAAQWLCRQEKMTELAFVKFLQVGVSISSVLFVCLFGVLLIGDIPENKSAKKLVEHYELGNINRSSLIYFGDRPFSASFYSDGKALVTESDDMLAGLAEGKDFYLAIRPKDESKLSTELQEKLHDGEALGRYKLYRVSNDAEEKVGTR